MFCPIFVSCQFVHCFLCSNSGKKRIISAATDDKRKPVNHARHWAIQNVELFLFGSDTLNTVNSKHTFRRVLNVANENVGLRGNFGPL